jgi:hypothetical protein
MSMPRFTSFVMALSRLVGRGDRWRPVAAAVLLASVAGSWRPVVAANPPETAPPELLQWLADLDAAASEGDVDQVMQFYSPEFLSDDGLTHGDMETALASLWQQYPGLTYETQLLSWEMQGDALVTETMTLVTGTPTVGDRPFEFTSTLEARQTIVDQAITAQTVLAEETVLMSGTRPPTVQINLPETVVVGRSFVFDAIVQEPLGDGRLLGAAIDEPVTLDSYLNPVDVRLNLLPAGGLFKVGRAPDSPGSYWISAVLVRDDGMTMITRRLQVVLPGGDRAGF